MSLNILNWQEHSALSYCNVYDLFPVVIGCKKILVFLYILHVLLPLLPISVLLPLFMMSVLLALLISTLSDRLVTVFLAFSRGNILNLIFSTVSARIMKVSTNTKAAAITTISTIIHVPIGCGVPATQLSSGTTKMVSTYEFLTALDKVHLV